MSAPKKLKDLKNHIKKIDALSLSMRLRLFILLVVLVVIMMLGIFIIFLLNGSFTISLKENEQQIKNEVNHTANEIAQYFGQLSVEAVDFSKHLSLSMENTLNQNGIRLSDLHNHPEVLEELLASEYDRALFSLEKSKCSGVFIIINATINTKLENASDSRAGLFIKNMEPNIISSSAPTIVLLRGFPDIGRKNHLPLHAQWSMEFNISEASYYQLPLEKAKQQDLDLSRLYYWTPSFELPGTSEEIMLCSVPLIDSKGTVFGACGLEVSAMLFKLANMPNKSPYARTVSIFAPITEETITTSNAMLAGDYLLPELDLRTQPLQIEKNQKYFYSYNTGTDTNLLGFHQLIQLYPHDSAFSDQKWVSALLIPENDIKDVIAGLNKRFALMLFLFMIIGISISYFLSRHYVDSLSLYNNQAINNSTEAQPSILISEFLKNIKALSPAEQAVFDLYVQHYTAKEIANSLCLSINTIKTHSKRIYTKLNVTSREELLLYIEMVKDSGFDFS